jgi:hypothetical protein
MSPWWKSRAGRGPLAGARTRRGAWLADLSQTARGTRAEEAEDNWELLAPSHDPSAPPSTAPIRARKNRVAPTDLGHDVQGRVGDPPSKGDQVPCHRVTLRTAEQPEPKQPQRLRLEEPIDCLLLGVICLVISIHKQNQTLVLLFSYNQNRREIWGKGPYAKLLKPRQGGSVNVHELLVQGGRVIVPRNVRELSEELRTAVSGDVRDPQGLALTRKAHQ